MILPFVLFVGLSCSGTQCTLNYTSYYASLDDCIKAESTVKMDFSGAKYNNVAFCKSVNTTECYNYQGDQLREADACKDLEVINK